VNNRVVGFDFGLKKIGVATGNLLTRTSQALPALDARRGQPDWDRLSAMVSEWRPGRLVCGLPVGLNGEETPMSARARAFSEDLSKRTGLDVILVDERYTSAAADSLLREAALAGKGMARQVEKRRDSVAAELIIQSYFNDNPDLPST